MSAQELGKIAENIRQLEMLKSSGAMPADLADASIAALRKELEKYRATLIGSGAIAQGDNATAVGKGGVIISGSVGGDIVSGDSNYIGHRPRTDDEALSVYCRVLMQSVQALPLRGLGVGANDPADRTNVKLDFVYIDLDTTSVVDKHDKQNKRGRK